MQDLLNAVQIAFIREHGKFIIHGTFPEIRDFEAKHERQIHDLFGATGIDWAVENFFKMCEMGYIDLDATLPIDPRETAQRDHDRIVRLEAENAKMHGLLEGLAKFKDSENGNLRHFATRAWNLLNRS